MKKLMKTLAGGLLAGALAVIISSGTALAADVEINESNFSDKAFRIYVEEKIDKNADKKLSAEEIADTTYINVGQSDIESLKGIEYFNNLKFLECGNNKLTELNLNNNTLLLEVKAHNNQLKTLSFDNNKVLEDVYAPDNQLNSLSLENNTQLKSIDVSNNNLSTIDVSKNINLTNIDIEENQITKIDLSKVTELTNLYAAGNNLTTIDFSANPHLVKVILKENALAQVDFSANAELVSVDCSYNNLLDIKLPDKPDNIKWLLLNGNNLTKLELDKLTNLGVLYLADNNLYNIDLSKNTKLANLDLSGNHFAAFDLTSNTLLTRVDLSRNERQIYVNNTNAADLTGTFITLDKISKIETADVATGTALTIGKDGKFPEKVEYTYEAGNGIKANIKLIPEGTKKIIAKNSVINIYLKDVKEGEQQFVYPLLSQAIALGGAPQITWSSADSAIAKIDENGNVVPVSIGQTTLTASAQDYDMATVTVNVLKEGQSIDISSIEDQYYTGSEVKPVPVVKMGDTILKENTDYTLSYSNNTDVGTAYITVKGKGMYTFEMVKKFNICYNIANMISDAIADQIYTGSAVTPDVVIKNGTTVLVKDIDYTLTYTNNTALGTAIVTVTGKGKYAGMKIQSFNIVVEQVKNLRVSTRKATSLTLTWDIVSGADGYRIYKYDATTKKYKYLKQLNGKDTNSYTDSNLVQGTQYRYRVRAFKLIDNVKKYGKYCPKYKTYTKPKKVSLKTKKGSKKVTLSWAKVTGAQGYRVYMKTGNGSFSRIKEIKKGATVSYTKSGLTKGKTYYFKVRAFREIDGVKVYGAYSKIKTVVAK